MNEPETIRKIFHESKNIAVVGLSDDASRYSFKVASFLMLNGFEIIPVNPNIDSWRGKKSYTKLSAIPMKIDAVDIFRKSEFVKEIVDEAIAIRAKAVWMQEGVVDEAAATYAEEKGLLVVMDRCMMKEFVNFKK
jgi:hypothetical protein